MTVDSLTMYQLKISLEGTKPPIWRRVLVSNQTSLEDLHMIIQITMGWYNCHLHQFIHEGTLYGQPDEDFGMEIKDEQKFKLQQLLTKEKDSLRYDYDFGDDWTHKIILEKILPHDKKIMLPRCLKAVRACPPEDCGGIWGYKAMIETLADKNHTDYKSLIEWLGEGFDPKDSGDLKETNDLLEEYCCN